MLRLTLSPVAEPSLSLLAAVDHGGEPIFDASTCANNKEVTPTGIDDVDMST
jgi:hypothetical protein